MPDDKPTDKPGPKQQDHPDGQTPQKTPVDPSDEDFSHPKIYGHDWADTQLLIWINSFIDGYATGTSPTPKGEKYDEYAGKRLISFPIVHFAGETLKPLGFITDNRHFSNRLTGITFRARSLKGFRWAGGPASEIPDGKEAAEIQRTGTTVGFFYTLESHLMQGEGQQYEIKTGHASTAGMKWQAFEPKDGVFTIEIEAEASDPLIPKAPSLKYKGKVTVTTGTLVTVRFEGGVGRYPWYECYALKLGSKQPTTIFQVSPEDGAGPMSLIDKVPLKEVKVGPIKVE